MRFFFVHLLAEWRNNSLRHEVGHLGLVAADGQVGDGPGRLLLSLELPLGQVGDDHGHQPRLDHGLDLLLVARSDVGQEPNCLLNIIKSYNLSPKLIITNLVYFLLGVVEERGEVFQSSVVENSLSLIICTRHYVANSSQGCCLHLHFSKICRYLETLVLEATLMDF